LSSAGKNTAGFLLAGACDSHVPYVRCVGWKPRFRTKRGAGALHWHQWRQLLIATGR